MPCTCSTVSYLLGPPSFRYRAILQCPADSLLLGGQLSVRLRDARFRFALRCSAVFDGGVRLGKRGRKRTRVSRQQGRAMGSIRVQVCPVRFESTRGTGIYTTPPTFFSGVQALS